MVASYKLACNAIFCHAATVESKKGNITLQYITVQNRHMFSDQWHRCAHVTEEASQMASFQSSVTPL